MRSIQQILEKTDYRESDLDSFWIECSIDFLFFAKNMFAFKIAEYHKEWFEMAETYDRLGIEAFRGSGKTFFFAAYYIWKAVFHAGTEFMIVSNRLEQAKYIMKVIRLLVGDNDILKQFMPETREQSWRATELEFSNKSIFYCRTYAESIRTLHPDYILCDEAGEYEDKTIFYTAILGTIQLKKGRVVAIGTPKSSIDLLAELEDNDEYMFKKYPVEKGGKAIWPEMYTMAPFDTDNKRSIQKIRLEMGELRFMQEYMLVPMSSANSLLPIDITSKCVVNSLQFQPYGRQNVRYYMGYDIASSPKGDYTVMTIMEVSTTHKTVVYIKRFRDTFDNQKVVFAELVRKFNPSKICIDATGLGEKQAIDLQQEASGVELVKFNFNNKLQMLTDLRREFDSGNIVLPNSQEDNSYQMTQLLLQEMNDMALKVDMTSGSRNVNKFVSGRYDDMVISLALANKATISSYGTVSFRSI